MEGASAVDLAAVDLAGECGWEAVAVSAAEALVVGLAG